MKIGLISDIHGNKFAFEKCYNFLQYSGIDDIYFLGDAIGYYPYSIDVLHSLKASGINCLMGNHEAMLLQILEYPMERDDIYRLNVLKSEIPDSLTDFIKSFSLFRELKFGNKKILLIHGSPLNPLSGYVYPDTDLSSFANLPFDTIIMANTHIPFIKKQYNKTIANIGSCGMPRDNGNYSSLGIYDTITDEIKIYRLKIDNEAFCDCAMKEVHFSVLSLHNRKSISLFGEIVG